MIIHIKSYQRNYFMPHMPNIYPKRSNFVKLAAYLSRNCSRISFIFTIDQPTAVNPRKIPFLSASSLFPLQISSNFVRLSKSLNHSVTNQLKREKNSSPINSHQIKPNKEINLFRSKDECYRCSKADPADG